MTMAILQNMQHKKKKPVVPLVYICCSVVAMHGGFSTSVENIHVCRRQRWPPDWFPTSSVTLKAIFWFKCESYTAVHLLVWAQRPFMVHACPGAVASTPHAPVPCPRTQEPCPRPPFHLGTVHHLRLQMNWTLGSIMPRSRPRTLVWSVLLEMS